MINMVLYFVHIGILRSPLGIDNVYNGFTVPEAYSEILILRIKKAYG